ncbi:MAG: hypothetical protein GVY24_00390 [Planctomycetes bacterium]|nr:hypothetical protein [Planctomycetota bacterium]
MDRTRHHRLEDILASVIMAVISVAEGPTHMADFGRPEGITASCRCWASTFGCDGPHINPAFLFVVRPGT